MCLQIHPLSLEPFAEAARKAAWDIHIPDMEQLLDEPFEYFLPRGMIIRCNI